MKLTVTLLTVAAFASVPLWLRDPYLMNALITTGIFIIGAMSPRLEVSDRSGFERRLRRCVRLGIGGDLGRRVFLLGERCVFILRGGGVVVCVGCGGVGSTRAEPI